MPTNWTDAAGSRNTLTLEEVLPLLASRDIHALRDALQRALARKGLAAFVDGTVADLVFRVGEAWKRGDFQVFEEHFFSETLRNVLETATPHDTDSGNARHVLLTALPESCIPSASSWSTRCSPKRAPIASCSAPRRRCGKSSKPSAPTAANSSACLSARNTRMTWFPRRWRSCARCCLATRRSGRAARGPVGPRTFRPGSGSSKR